MLERAEGLRSSSPCGGRERECGREREREKGEEREKKRGGVRAKNTNTHRHTDRKSKARSSNSFFHLYESSNAVSSRWPTLLIHRGLYVYIYFLRTNFHIRLY